MDEVLPEAALSDFSLKAACVAIKQYIDTTFSRLLLDISDALAKVQYRPKKGAEEYTLQAALDTSKKAVMEGSMNVLQVRHDKADNHYSFLYKKCNRASCSSYCCGFLTHTLGTLVPMIEANGFATATAAAAAAKLLWKLLSAVLDNLLVVVDMFRKLDIHSFGWFKLFVQFRT